MIERGLLTAGLILAALACGSSALGAGRFMPEELGLPASWEARTDWLSAASEGHSVRATAEGLEFAIPEAGRGMKWSAGLRRPVDVDDTPYLVLRYRCRNYDPGRDYLLWVGSQAHRGGLRILAGDAIRADGHWHTAALDLVAFGVDTFQQLALQCFSTGAGDGRLTIGVLELAEDAPEDAERYPAASGEGVVASYHFEDPEAWRAQPSWLANPTERVSLSRTEEGLRFEVAEVARGMKWSCDLAEELPGGYLKMRYRARGLEGYGDYALYAAVSGGGRSEQEQYVFLLSDLQPDGDWHVVTAFYEAELVKTFAVQVQAREPEAWLEIASVEVWGRRPEVTLSEVCSYRAGWADDLGAYRPVVLPEGVPGERAARALRLSGWFEAPRVTVQGIPFDLSSGQALLSPGEVIGPTDVPVTGRYRQVYLLLGSRTPTQEDPSYSGMPAGVTVYPHRFVAELVYADGGQEWQMPTRLSTGRPEVAKGVGAYALATDETRELRTVRLHDGHRRGAFVLAGVTGSSEDGPATEATRPRPAVKLQPRKATTRECHVARVGDGVLRVQSGALRAEFGVREELALRSLTSEYLADAARAGEGSVLEGSSVLSVKVGDREMDAAQAQVTRVEQLGDRAAAVSLDFRPGLALTARVRISAPRPDEIRLDVALEPVGETLAAEPVVEMPVLRGGRASVAPGDTWVFFPRRGTVISNRPTGASVPYGGMFPLQVMGFYNPAGGGVYLRTEYEEPVDRRYHVRRMGEGVDLGVQYPWWRGERLNAIIGTNPGDWHEQLGAYDEWRQSWFRPAAARKEWFRQVFNFRQQFLHFALPTKSGMFDAETKDLRLMEVLEHDKAAFGGVDYLHIFDWGWAPETGRCGDYEPWDYLGGAESFRRAVEEVQKTGVRVGLYIEGYLVSPGSKLFERAQAWQVIKPNGEPLEAFAPDVNMCPWVKEWQEYLPGVYARARRETGALGYYIDEYGFAHDAHGCWSSQHGHPAPVYATGGELQMTQRVREALGPDCAIYTEETPCDVTMQWQDGSFTYAISSVSDDLSPHRLNLQRFAVPDFKTIEIITCDRPLGDNLEALKRILFNGEAIWIEGVPEMWFDERSLDFIRRMHTVMSSQADCFTSLQPEALVPTEWEGLYANRFPSQDGGKCLWTVYWTGPRSLTGNLLRVGRVEGVRYRELWDGRDLSARPDGPEDVIAGTIHPHEVLVLLREPAS